MKVELKNILCATDLSDFSSHAVSYAIAIAREFDAKLYLCHIFDLPSFSVHGTAYMFQPQQQDNLLKYAREKLEILMEKQSIKWELIVTTGPVADTVSRQAEEKKIDMAVVATHARSGLKRLFLGSVTERLIRTISCPLLIVVPSDTDTSSDLIEELNFKNILVGCDFSPDSDRAVEYGLNLALEFQAGIHLVHVVKPVDYEKIVPSGAMTEELRENLYENSNRKLLSLIPEETHHWCKVKTDCLTGEPFEEISKYAVLNEIDLIVMGVRGLNMVKTLFLGSTTDRVLRRSVCPVLSVCRIEK